MANEKDTPSFSPKPPKKITKTEADRMKSYAQGLGDEITHVVDYGEGLGEEKADDTDYGDSLNNSEK
jgi:hypothetical protein